MTTLYAQGVSGAPISAADWNANWLLAQQSVADLGPFVVTGLVPTAGAGLSVSVSAGTASIGARITAAGSFSIAGLTNSTTNHLYLLDSGLGTSNTTGTQPADSVKLGTATTSGGAVTSVNVLRSSGRQLLVRHESQVPGAVGSPGSLNLASWNATAGDTFSFYGALPSGALPAIAFDDLSDVTLTSQARGDVVYRGASAWLNLPASTSGLYLKTQGGGADPIWADPALPTVILAPAASTRNLVTPTGVFTALRLQFGSASPGTTPMQTWEDSTGQKWGSVEPAYLNRPGFRLLSNTDATNYQDLKIFGTDYNSVCIQAGKGGSAAATQLTLRAGATGLETGGTYMNLSAGRVDFGTSNAAFEWGFPTDKSFSIFPDPRTVDLSSSAALTLSTYGNWSISNVNTQKYLRINPTWAPISSTGKFITVNIEPTINQTGSATGDYTALRVMPTETAATGTNKWLLETGVGGETRFVINNLGDAEIRRKDSTTAGSLVGTIVGGFNSNTHASYTGRIVFSATDASGTRECLRIEGDGSAARIGFLGASAVIRQGAYTQTYSTASRTNPNVTSSAVLTTAAGLASYGYTQAQADSIPVAINAIAADLLALKQLVNALVDDSQAFGFSS